MSDKQPMSGNLVGPFSTITKYEEPVVDGFIGVPRSDINEPGWGQPLKDENGAPITPGTLGGPGQAAIVDKKKGTYRIRRSKTVQKFGEISWRGPKKSDKPDAKRRIISYHGPSTRHFVTASFSYGSDPKHRNVYMEGGLIGIAPGPVLGGCLKSISNKWYLLVVCLAPEGEIVLCRAAGAPVYSDDESKLAKLSQFAGETYKDGWVKSGIVSVDAEYRTPATPWFFNESGTEAQCIRQKTKEGVINGEPKEELAGDRFKLTFAGTAASLTPMGNLPAFEFEERGSIVNKGRWTSPPDNQGYPHVWDELSLQVFASCSGAQVVAVDYDGDEEILVKAEIQTSYGMYQDYMKGMDHELYSATPIGDPPTYRNNNSGGTSTSWATYSNPNNLGIDPTATVGNHEGACWFSGSAQTFLSFKKGGTEYRISLEMSGTQTATQYAEMPPNPQDHTLFLRYYETQYVRFLDVRAGGLVCTSMEQFDEWVTQGTITKSACETYDTDFSDDKLETISEGQAVHEFMTATYHAKLNRNSYQRPDRMWDVVSGVGSGSEAGWSQEPWSWSATTWVGDRPTNNDADEDTINAEGKIGNLPIRSWFPRESPLYRKSWYGLKILYHDRNTESAAFCQREDKTFILSGALPHPDTGEPTSFLITHPKEMADVIDGPVYYPIGEL